MQHKLLLILPTILLVATSCTKQIDTTKPYKVSSNAEWVQELAEKNPLKDSANYTSVYFRFDTIINDFEVNGIFYPSYFPEYGWDAHENGVYLYFHSLNTGKEYCYTTWDNTCGCFSSYFMSINITNIVYDKSFGGFKNGDAYIFRYNTTIDTISDNSLLPYAEYQFYDADFDGEEELIIGSYVGGPHGSPCYDIYDMTDSALSGLIQTLNLIPKICRLEIPFIVAHMRGGNMFTKLIKKGSIICCPTYILKVTLTIISNIPILLFTNKAFNMAKNCKRR